MSRPDGREGPKPERTERRHPRAPIQLLIQYRFESYEEFLAQYSTDISAGGMFVLSEQPRERGTFVYLQFSLKDGARLIEGLGRVVHVSPPGDPSRPAGMGIEFVDFDPESIALLEKIVSSKLPRPKED